MDARLKSDLKSIKFLYSYGGRISPRSSDGKLRYVGGHTRVLSVDRSIAFSELMVKFGELCGSSMILKCKLPEEDLDTLVTIKSDEELRSIIEEYEISIPESKLRAVLFPITSVKKASPPSSPMSCFDFPSAPKPLLHKALSGGCNCPAPLYAAATRCSHPAVGYPVTARKYRLREARSPVIHHVPRPNQSR